MSDVRRNNFRYILIWSTINGSRPQIHRLVANSLDELVQFIIEHRYKHPQLLRDVTERESFATDPITTRVVCPPVGAMIFDCEAGWEFADEQYIMFNDRVRFLAAEERKANEHKA